MKICRLDLAAYGPFSGVVVDLAGGSSGLHLVYGPNEAGKSSALKALTRLLYGIPHQTGAVFRHAAGDLRIGARLQLADGTVLEVVRRKGRKNTLLTPAGDVLSETVLDRYRAGLDRETFKTVFGLNRDRMQAGGKAIAQGGGELGQSIFAAGSGLSDLRRVLADLESRAGDLFKPLGRNQVLNSLLATHADLQHQCEQASLTAGQWEAENDALQSAVERKETVAVQVRETAGELNRLKRIAAALPAAAERRQVLADLADAGSPPLLPPEFSQERRGLETAIAEMETSAGENRKTLAEVEAHLAAFDEDQPLLAAGEEIDALYATLGGPQKALADLPQRRAEFYRLQEEAAAALERISPGMALAEAAGLRLSDAQVARIRALGRRQATLEERLAAARQAEAGVRADLAALAADMKQIPPPIPTEPLEAVLQEIRRHGDLDKQAAEQKADFESQQRRINSRCSRLGLSGCPLESLPGLVVPDNTILSRFASDFDRSNRHLDRLTADIAANDRRQQETVDKMRRLESDGRVPALDDLVAARQRRDATWRALRDAVLDPPRQDADTGYPLLAIAKLVPQMERHTIEADAAADRLREASEKVAAMAALNADRAALERNRQTLDTDFRAAQEQRSGLERKWEALWPLMGFPVLTPAEMRAWRTAFDDLLEEIAALQRLAAALAATSATISTLAAEARAALAAADRDAGDGTEPLLRLAGRCETAVEDDRRNSQNRIHAAAQQQKLMLRIESCAEERRQLEREIDQWRDQWQAAVAAAGLPPEATFEEAEAVLARLQQLFDRLDLAQAVEGRI